jgi:hypothetical protein
MVVLAFIVFAYFEDDRIQPTLHPADSAVLFGLIGTLVEIVRMREYFLRLFKPDGSFGIGA